MLGKSKRSGLKKLQEFVDTHEGVEGYLEPQTPILPQSLLLIARNGEWARAPAPDRGQAAGFCKKFGVPFYDAAIVGYPERMRGAKGAPAPESPTVDQLQAWWAQDEGAAPDEERSMNEAKTGVLMVVEDDPDVRLLVRVTLEPDPRLEIKGEASNAEEALAFLEDHQQIGLVILDHMLDEGMSGLEAAPLMKAAAPHIRVLLFSALDLERQAKDERAIDGFLLKTQIERLLLTCQELLGLTPLH